MIVNDMNSINIDAFLVSKQSLIQKEEQLVELQNGCICCTLRGDLLQEINYLADRGEFDYLVIESTGISEPMQVAETFAMTKEDLQSLKNPDPSSSETDMNEKSLALQSLVGVAKLDTCVTVIDVSNLLSYFDQAKLLGQEFQNVDAGDERSVVDLLCDQIEFANVIILNKMSSVSPDIAIKCRGLVQKLNPTAKILESNYCQVDLKEILNTGAFDMARAVTSAGWMKSLQEEHIPETEEYGISSFVYQARLPFHPNRIFELLQTNFIIIENPGPNGCDDFMGEGADGEEEELESTEEIDTTENIQNHTEGEISFMEVDQNEAAMRLENKKRSAFSTVFRSKGFMWIATRPNFMGEWSQAGLMITIGNSGYWFSELDETMWPGEENVRQKIRSKFADDFGDKRQEIVFIGQFQKKRNAREKLIKMLDSCLLTEKEWKSYLKGDVDGWEDPWECWECEHSDNKDNGEDEEMRSL